MISPKENTISFKDFSPFKISKALNETMKHSMKSVQKEGRSIVVEVEKAEDSEALLKVNSFLEVPVEVAPHRRLNSSRGVIRSWDFKNATPEEWLTVPSIIDARQIVSRRGGVEKKTPLWVLTFDTPTLPLYIKVAYHRLDVRPYISKPLRCFKCQRFGHPGKYCRNREVCIQCGKAEAHTDCKEEPWCPNCRATGHTAASKDCPSFNKEKLILEHVANHGGSYTQVRDALFPRNSYAESAKKLTSQANLPVKPSPVRKDIQKQSPSVSDTSKTEKTKKRRLVSPPRHTRSEIPLSNKFSVLDDESDQQEDTMVVETPSSLSGSTSFKSTQSSSETPSNQRSSQKTSPSLPGSTSLKLTQPRSETPSDQRSSQKPSPSPSRPPLPRPPPVLSRSSSTSSVKTSKTNEKDPQEAKHASSGPHFTGKPKSNEKPKTDKKQQLKSAVVKPNPK